MEVTQKCSWLITLMDISQELSAYKALTTGSMQNFKSWICGKIKGVFNLLSPYPAINVGTNYALSSKDI